LSFFLSAFALSQIATDCYRLFFRLEDQGALPHPTRVHIMGRVVRSQKRTFNEFVFKVMQPGYVPGKFRSRVARFPDWLQRRRVLLGPSALHGY
jgi:hypothetical protein